MDNAPQSDAADSIAIIGLAGRFPGAPSIDMFWENLKHGKEAIQFFTDAELACCEPDFASLKNNPDYVKAGAALKDVDFFDASFFGFTPKEAAAIDPQHRIFLECAWEALEHAGYNPEAYSGPIGVFAGCRMNTYFLNNLCADRNFINNFIRDRSIDALPQLIGNDKDFLPTRVSYKLNLKGPSVNVQTGCSTSLVAVCMACQSLLTYESDMALAGGVAIKFPQQRGYLYREGRMESPDGHCRPFDAQANGTVFGNGAGVVVLKRLEDALADGDAIYAVIKGTAINNDGSAKVSYTAPSVDGQATVIAMAHAVAGIDPETVTYIEAHGTGTKLGDPIEIAGLTKAFRAKTAGVGFCGIGSVKSNIGHLDTASGIASLVKTVLALQHKLLPPSINYLSPNPEIDFSGSPFYVVTQPTPWHASGMPRRAGVSSFGVGGTNAHVVLEEAPAVQPSGASRPYQLLTLSARTHTALETMTSNLAGHLRHHAELSLHDAAYTLQTGRKDFACRRMLVCADRDEALQALEGLEPEQVITSRAMPATPSAVFVFPGTGSYEQMGRSLYETEPVFKEHFDRCCCIFADLTGSDPLSHLHADGRCAGTASQQPHAPARELHALFAVEYALAQLVREWGVAPAFYLGSGAGAYVAACLAGIFTLEDAAVLLTCQPGSVTHAASGSKSEKAWRNRLRAIQLNPPAVPLITSATKTWVTDDEALDIAYWEKQLDSVHDCSASIKRLPHDPCRIHLIVGPAQGVSVKGHADNQDSVPLLRAASSTEPEAILLMHAVGRLWLAGASIDWTSFYKHERCARVPLPTYPFERIRCWVDPPGDMTPHDLQPAAGRDSAPSNPLLPAENFMQENTQHETAQSGLAAMPGSRREPLLAAIKRILHALSGIEPAAIDPAMTFLDLGFDSLFMTQLSMEFKKEFGVKMTLRLLLEDVTSPDILAAYLDKELPPDAYAPAAPSAIPGQTAGSGTRGVYADVPSQTSAFPQGQAPQSLIESVIAQQLSMMQQQLDLLRSSGEALISLPSGGPGVQSLQQELPAAVSAAPAAQQAVPDEGKEFKRFGPYKPFEKDKDKKSEGLTSSQQRSLNDLIGRYQHRTTGSKRMTQEHRFCFADPRAVAGFKTIWKEITYPIIAQRALGSKIWDVDGNEWLDVTMGFGAHLFGLSPPFITEAVEAQLKRGVAIGPQSDTAGEVASLICEFTGMERATFCNTGSEAVLGALRAARTVTGRDKVALFAGDYHGINDEMLIRAVGPQGSRRSFPIAPGIPAGMVQNVVVLDYGSPESLAFLEAQSRDFAAVIVEPVQARRPELQPGAFLRSVRELTRKSGTALVFDEVITGFRVHPGGAQAWFDVRADIATYGKVIGGGMPIGIIAGKADYMDAFDGGMWQYGDDSIPEAGVTFFAGTFVRHPIAMAAARAVLHYLKEHSPRLQQTLNERTDRFAESLNRSLEQFGVPVRLTHFASMCYFSHADEMKFFSLLFHYMRDRGVHIWEGRPFFISTAHTDEDIAFLTRAFTDSLAEMRDAGFLEALEASRPAAVSPSRSDAGAAAAPSEFSLSDAQMEIWLVARLSDEGSCAFNESSTFTFRGAMNVEAMKRGLQRIVERHEALRATFADDGSAQRVQPSLSLDIPVKDLTLMDPDKRAAEIKQIIEHDVHQPFDLVRGPLMRAQILKIEERLHLMVLTAHHIVCDGWSYDVMVHDLSRVYSMECAGVADSRPRPGQISDYVAWQENEKQDPAYAETEAYWAEHLAGELPVLALPADRQRPAQKSYSGAREVMAIDPALYARVKSAGAANKCTLFSTLLAAYALLLHRLTGQDDIIVGIPAAGQSVFGESDLVGHCTNLLPLRFRIDSSQPFSAFLKAVQGSVLDAFEHQIVTYGELVKKLRLPRDSSRSPLLGAMFNVDPAVHGLDFAGLDVEIVANPRCGFQFDLGFNMVASDAQLTLECDYGTALFDAATMHRWMGYYQNLLESIVNDFERPISALAVLSAADLEQLVVVWNRTVRAYPEHCCLPELFEAEAEKTPDAAAAVFGRERISYGELNSRANRLARYLKGLGVGPEKLVGIYVERSLPMLVGLLGILKAGSAYVPLDPLFPKERLAFMLADAGVSVLVTQESLADELPRPAGVQAVCLDAGWPEISRESGDNLPEKAKPEHPAYVIYTSGSTGVPKGVEITHRALVNFLCSMRDEPGIAADDVLLAVTTLSFDIAGLELFLPLIAGARVVIAPPEIVVDGVRLTALLKESGATIMQATPITWRMLLEAGWRGNRGLKILCGGEAFPADLAGPLLERGSEVWNMYGPTETTIWSTVYRIRNKDGPVLIGRPIANTQIYILDDHMMPVPVGVAGELYIGGDGVARGYLNRPELTAERFVVHAFSDNHRKRLYRTGDLARYRHDGTIECLGRSDFQVKIRGYRIEPEEIETVLQKHPAVRSAVVAARDAGGGDKRLVAYLICEPSTEQPSAHALRELAHATLPAYMIPSAYVFLDSFPLTPNGKINRAALPAPDAAAQADDADVYTPPRNAIELTIASVWQSLLHVKRVGIHDSFFEIGGHSLLAVQLFARLEKIFHKQLPLATLFEAQTVEKLAAIFSSQDWKPSWASLVPIQPGGSKPLFFCVHGAGGNVLLYRDLARHMGADQPFYGLQAKGLDGKQPFHTRIEDMAADYIQEIRQLQPEGPYCLGGYCMGGDIAFEMARQLVQQGQTVAFLALLDTQRQWITNLKPYMKWYQRYQQIAFHMGNFLQADMQGKRGFLLEKASEAGRRIKRRYDIARSEIAYALKLRVEEPLVLMEKINDNASIAYHPDPYPGRVTLFYPRTNYAGYNDPLYGWGNGLTAGVDVQQLSSYPAGMLVEPFVAELAEKLKACLDNACAQQGSAAAP